MTDNSAVIDRDYGFKVAVQATETLRDAAVEVGIFSGSFAGSGADIATYAAINEYGSAGASAEGYYQPHGQGSASGKEHVPERSFMRSTVDANGPKYERYIGTLAQSILAGRMTVEGAMLALGKLVEGDIKRKIRDGDPSWPAHAQSTIDRHGTDYRLLWDTGAMINAITEKVIVGSNTSGGFIAPETTYGFSSPDYASMIDSAGGGFGGGFNLSTYED